MHFETDSISVDKGATFTNLLVIENKSSEEITLRNLIPSTKYPGLLFYPKNDFTLNAGEAKKLPVKFIANVDFLKLNSKEIKFEISYSSSVGTKTESASFTVKKEENKSVAIYTAAYENFINPNLPDSSIFLFLENQSYTKRTIKLDLQSIPDGLEMMPKQQTISLEGLEKQRIEIKIVVRKQNTLFPEYNIQAIATDLETNEFAGNNTINLTLLSNNRQISRGNESMGEGNFAELGYNGNNSGFNYLQLRGNAALQVNQNTTARFNIGSDYYLEDGLYNLYDTWLEVERKKSLLRVGNVFGSDYDYSVSGRGGKFVTQLGEKKQIELLALENNYNLYGTYFQQAVGSTMMGAKYAFGNAKSFSGKISYVFDHDPRLSVDTQVVNAVTSLLIDDKHTLRTELGLSQEKGLLNKDENAGATMGFNYMGKLGAWDLQSSNSFATKNYAGLKRGSFFSNQRIGRELSATQRAFIHYQKSQIDPEFLSVQNAPISAENTVNYRYYYNNTESFGAGYQFSLKNWNILISPRIEKQKTANFNSSNELFSYRLETNIGTTLGAHGLNLMGEYSYSNEKHQPDWFHSLKATLSYSFKSFSLNGTAQWNANNVFDLNSLYNNDRHFAIYNFYSSYNFNMLNRALVGSLSAGAYYSELYKNLNSNVAGNLEYKISQSWSSTGYFNLSGYKSNAALGNSGSYYQFRVGVKKYFAAATGLGNHKVSLQLFEDKNSNGLLDAGEKVLQSEIVKLDNFVAITDQNGKIVFQNVPEGIYKLRVNETSGARLMMDPVIVVEKNMNLKIGLVKNTRVSGKLKEIRQTYDELETDVTGTVVYAKGEDGKIHSVLVNQKNEFDFYLKEGKYDLYIENDKYSYTKPTQSIQVTKEDTVELVVFEYKKKDTVIKVKKF